jgi:hypothetical protein
MEYVQITCMFQLYLYVILELHFFISYKKVIIKN